VFIAQQPAWLLQWFSMLVRPHNGPVLFSELPLTHSQNGEVYEIV
jgi:hypothetical protein